MRDLNETPIVSVIIPAYNSGLYLTHAIETVLAQTYPQVELIVVNDGSTDPITRETAARYSGRILYIEREENGGVAAARNTGIKASSGSLIAVLDQDDGWLPHKLEKQVYDLANYPRAVLSHTSYYLMNRQGERIGVSHMPGGEWEPLPSILMEVPVAVSSILARREAIERADGFDPTIPGTADWDLWLRMAARGGTFVCNANPLTEYRQHESNMSHNPNLMLPPAFRTLDKFYSMPGVPAVALAWRDRAYVRLHIWAATSFYIAGSFPEARRHLILAARLRLESVTSLRFLRSMLNVGQRQGGNTDSLRALQFTISALRQVGLPDAKMKQIEHRARLLLALTSRPAGKQVTNTLNVLLTTPKLLGDGQLWWEGISWASKKLNKVREHSLALLDSRIGRS